MILLRDVYWAILGPFIDEAPASLPATENPDIIAPLIEIKLVESNVT